MGQRASDEYPTPPLLATEITRWALSMWPPTREHGVTILEPGAGKHAPFLRAADQLIGPIADCVGVELGDYPRPDPEFGWHPNCDFTNPNQFGSTHPFDLVITNPPYSLAQEFVERAHAVVNHWGLIVMLLQTGFNGARSRVDFWARYRPIAKRTIRPRPGFVASTKSTATRDMREYMAVVWPGPALARFLTNVGRDWCTDGFLDCPHPKGWGRAEE